MFTAEEIKHFKAMRTLSEKGVERVERSRDRKRGEYVSTTERAVRVSAIVHMTAA